MLSYRCTQNTAEQLGFLSTDFRVRGAVPGELDTLKAFAACESSLLQLM